MTSPVTGSLIDSTFAVNFLSIRVLSRPWIPALVIALPRDLWLTEECLLDICEHEMHRTALSGQVADDRRQGEVKCRVVLGKNVTLNLLRLQGTSP